MREENFALRFSNRDAAENNFARIEQRLTPALAAPLRSLLAHSPDPDTALRLFVRYMDSAAPEVLEEVARHPSALIYLVAIFGYSESLGETFLAEPALVVQFARDRHFTRLKSAEDLMQDYARFAVTSPDPWLSSQLARFKRQNYLRVALKDVLGIATLGETTLELSILADVILNQALAFCEQELERRYGQPQHRDSGGRIARTGFSIVSLGKLGGNELDYSSDIDVLFLYACSGETAGGTEPSSIISNKEYYVRLAEAINRTITQSTPHGEVYRADLSLRPDGEAGDLAISLNSALEYYDHRARDWELQMLVKARHSAGDPGLTRAFLRGVEQYVYRSPVDVNTVEAEMKSRRDASQQAAASSDYSIDLRFHPGGIYDIEFLTQCLQRLHGAGDAWVRASGTLLALRRLNDKGLLSDGEYARLGSAYELFRKVEHRIQLSKDRNTPHLQGEQQSLHRLARRLGIEGALLTEGAPALGAQLEMAFAGVKEIYERTLHPQVATPAATDIKPKPLGFRDTG